MGTKFEKLTESEILDLLSSESVGHLGCCADKKMYVIPISYAFKDQQLFFHSREGLKLNIMRKNPQVCFQVDSRRNMANWQSVIVWGDFNELEGAERKNGLRALVNRKLPLLSSATTHLGPSWPFSTEELDAIEGVVFSIHVREMSGRAEETQEAPSYSL